MIASFALASAAVLGIADLEAIAARTWVQDNKSGMASIRDTSDLGAAVGQQFALSLPVVGDGEAATWSYDGTAHRLTVTATDAGRPNLLRYKVASWPRLFSVSGRSRAAGHFIGRNAFGARARVSVVESTDLRIGPFHDDDLYYSAAGETLEGPAPPGEFAGDAADRPHRFVMTLPIDPGPAKLILPHLRLLIEGVVTSAEPGRAAICDPEYVEPTLDSPVSMQIRNCWISARISRVAFVDSIGGATLKEWRPARQEASVPAP